MSAVQVKTVARSPRKIALSLHDGHSRGPLSYLDMGRRDAPCIVFIHGFGADLLTWYLCLIPLAASFRVVAVDLPGHGASTLDIGEAVLDDMIAWLKETLHLLDVPQAHIVAHSMGAKIAVGLCLDAPERVLSLGLVAPAGLGGDANHDALNAFLEAPSPQRAETFACSLLGPDSANLIPAMCRSLCEAVADPARLTALRDLLGHWQARPLSYFQTNATFAPHDLQRLRCPVLILWGEHDRILPATDSRCLPPQTRIETIPGAGHLPHMEAPLLVVRALKAFLPAPQAA